jgi:hypothetical protein
MLRVADLMMNRMTRLLNFCRAPPGNGGCDSSRGGRGTIRHVSVETYTTSTDMPSRMVSKVMTNQRVEIYPQQNRSDRCVWDSCGLDSNNSSQAGAVYRVLLSNHIW